MRGAGTVLTRLLTRSSGRVRRADSGGSKLMTRSSGRKSCIIHQPNNSLISLSSSFSISSLTVSGSLRSLSSSSSLFSQTGSGSLLGSDDHSVFPHPKIWALFWPFYAALNPRRRRCPPLSPCICFNGWLSSPARIPSPPGHAAWSWCGGIFCHDRRCNHTQTKVQRGIGWTSFYYQRTKQKNNKE